MLKPVKPWAPPGWHIRFFEQGKIEYLLRDEYYNKAFAHYMGIYHVEDNTDTREEALVALARGLYFIEASGNA